MRIGSIVIHCHDFDRTVAFWRAALHYVPREPATDRWLVLRDPTGRGADYVVREDPRGALFCVAQKADATVA